MLGVTLKIDENDLYLYIEISPQLVENKLDVNYIYSLIKKSEFSQLFIYEENVIDIITTYKASLKKDDKSVISARIGERKNCKIRCTILEDQLSAHLEITIGYGGKLPTTQSLINLLKKNNVKRGISTKRIAELVRKCSTANSGEILDNIVAIGLPPRAGKPSKLMPLVPNALERILMPQSVNESRVDMRNLGAIISVKIGAELLRRMPPGSGRNGYSVCGDVIEAKAGEWQNFRPGDGTVISDHDENLLVADISGMPKFKDQRMWVDDIFTCKGVNVGTGNVDYDGSVLVNGDVTEKMEITATGDITINGFVESATIKAGGDIIITEGAMGKVNDNATEYSTKLISKGNVHVQHGQGLDISCNGNVTIGRQLAHSKVLCKGKVTVGAIAKPNGNIFSCIINCNDGVSAGTFGAVSGSNLSIDFSEGFIRLIERKETLDELVKQLRQNSGRHMERIKLINSKSIPKDMQQRVDEANQLFQSEIQLLQWLEIKAAEVLKAKNDYQSNIQIIANKRIYPGVILKLNTKSWRPESELEATKISYLGHQWKVEPIT
ncbi:FapA family protein [uncultured Paraglaciecola sp.]|uniref:DUF342 domain-containing protein n=1 Tax=uncultured Paraglaciecola sp. TaxID=1765024 RepID=UPI002591F81E|nr:FapA family protein [uncultured Paraglaciecola sp.]